MSNAPPARSYYHARKYGAQVLQLKLEDLRGMFLSIYEQLSGDGFFDEHFGSHCVDAGFDPGLVGSDVMTYVLLKTGRRDLWPVADHIENWGEDELFTMVEFLHDHASKPGSSSYHDYANCGYHYYDFKGEPGRSTYRERMNFVLERYGEGWQLNEQGEVTALPPTGMKTLLAAPRPGMERSVDQKVRDAIDKYRLRTSKPSDRRDAVRDLADVLEWLRPQIKEVLLAEDERELFNIANNFGIRHMNQRQKTGYDEGVWLSWMFYHYLSTITAFQHMVSRQKA